MTPETTSKHTPGPWHLSNLSHRYVRYRLSTDATGYNICDMDVFGGPPDEKEANARLIAAAPELLEALEQICNLERRAFREAWDMLQEVDRLARTAIRKARGEVEELK